MIVTVPTRMVIKACSRRPHLGFYGGLCNSLVSRSRRDDILILGPAALERGGELVEFLEPHLGKVRVAGAQCLGRLPFLLPPPPRILFTLRPPHSAPEFNGARKWMLTPKTVKLERTNRDNMNACNIRTAGIG
eukprot:8737638-Pyramimonas_sp.AAC.1